MKKAASDSSTYHLFRDVDVRRATGRGDVKSATSVCGGFKHSGPFTGVGDLDSLDCCGNCEDVVSEE